MREQIPEITRKEIKELIPQRVLEVLDEEAVRLKEELLDKIHYAKGIRLAYEPAGQALKKISPDPAWNRMGSGAGYGGYSLSKIESDETARQIFAYQLQNESLLNGVCGMKIRTGKEYESALLFLRRKASKKLIEEYERDFVRRVRNRYFLESGSAPSASFGRNHGGRRGKGREYGDTGFYWPEEFQIAGMITTRKDLGRTMILGYLASEIGKDTQLLRACAARFNLIPALEMLELFDSIGFSTPAHIPDLFPRARSIRRHFIIHVGGTNTGKTHDSMEMMAHAPSGVYLSPLRMLAYEGREVVRQYGVPCSFATGEEKELQQGAKHISETIGMLDYDRFYDCAVIDECQLISGEDGSLYTNAILGVYAKTVCVCCAWSGLDITKRLIELCGDTWEVIEHHRTSELKFEETPYEGPRVHDAYIVFSRIGAHQMAEWLEEHGMTPSIVYGKLPYEVKMEEARKFEDGRTNCLVATDAIAIGQNYNIERIVFRDVTKFINRREIRLDSQTVKQVAGRAGRYGRFPVGYVNTWREADREEIRLKLQEEDVPSQVAPLELPAFLVDKELPLSLIYRAWTSSEAGEPFVKADTTTELFICRLIEEEYPSISKQHEYTLASLPLDLRDRAQLDLLRSLLSAMLRPTSDEEWKALLPDAEAIHRLVKWRPHLRDCEKLCRDLDLASSFFYKIRRDDLAEYVIRLKPPITKRIAQMMAEEIPDHAPGEKPHVSRQPDDKSQKLPASEQPDDRSQKLPASEQPDDRSQKQPVPESAEKPGKQKDSQIPVEDTSKWPTAYIYVSTSGQTERNTGRFPAGDWQKLYSRKLEQSFGNEASYIDYFCYKKKDRIPDYCRTDSCLRYTVKLDPQFIISDEGTHYLAERFLVVKTDFKEAQISYRPKKYRNRRRHRR